MQDTPPIFSGGHSTSCTKNERCRTACAWSTSICRTCARRPSACGSASARATNRRATPAARTSSSTCSSRGRRSIPLRSWPSIWTPSAVRSTPTPRARARATMRACSTSTLTARATCWPRCSSPQTLPRRTWPTSAASSARRWTCMPTRRRIWSRSGSSARPFPARSDARCSAVRPRSSG